MIGVFRMRGTFWAWIFVCVDEKFWDAKVAAIDGVPKSNVFFVLKK